MNSNFAKCNSPEFITGFLNIYKEHKCLWKVKDKCYSNKDLSKTAYEQLIAYYRQFDASATKDTVRCKINNLRSSFRKELKKVRKSERSGLASGDLYVPKLWYYHLLSFTADQKQPRKPVSTDTDTVDTDGEDVKDTVIHFECCEQEVSMTIECTPNLAVPPRSPSTSFAASDGNPDNKTSRIKKEIDHQPSEEDHEVNNTVAKSDEFDAIATVIACKLRRMDDGQRIIAEHLCNTVLYYGLQNRLQESSSVSCLPPGTENRPLNQRRPCRKAHYRKPN